MNIPRYTSSSRRFASVVCILYGLFFALLTLAGCSMVQVVTPPEADLLRQGERAFEMEDYDKAAASFTKVLDSFAGFQIKNTALYDLACTRLVTAQSDSDFSATVSLFDKWQKPNSSELYTENPNFMITAFRRWVKLNEHDKKRATKKNQENQTVIARQREKIQEMKNLLETLEHQMTELESIDQQLQEKKKPL